MLDKIATLPRLLLGPVEVRMFCASGSSHGPKPCLLFRLLMLQLG